MFEKESAVGGVWIESRTYPGLRTNNSRDTYAFSDHPYSRWADMFPTAAPPTEHRLGFVGYASSPACQLTSEISAHWLSQSFRGELTLPAVDEM